MRNGRPQQRRTRHVVRKCASPVAPTFFRKKPFGKNVEGLSYFRNESCAAERAVQTHDFEDSTLCIAIGGKPLLTKRLRKFKHFRRQLRSFVRRPVKGVNLTLDRREPVPDFRALACEGILIDAIGQPQVKQAILLGDDQSLLSLQLGRLSAGIRFCVSRLGREHRAKTIADTFILDAHPVDERQQLLAEIAIQYTNAGMARFRVFATVIVNVRARTAGSAE